MSFVQLRAHNANYNNIEIQFILYQPTSTFQVPLESLCKIAFVQLISIFLMFAKRIENLAYHLEQTTRVYHLTTAWGDSLGIEILDRNARPRRDKYLRPRSVYC